MNSKTVIIGAGFAGCHACRALARTGAEVLLFDPNSRTVMIPALPDLAGGWIPEKMISRPLRELLPRNVEHVQAAVTAIDLDRRILTAGGRHVPFDHLLICGGSVTNFHGFDQHIESVYRLDSLESALRIRDDFQTYLRRTDTPHLVIAGGGYTGLELAASLRFRSMADRNPCRVTVADPSDKILPFLSPAEHRRITRFLEESGIDVLHNTKATGFDGRTVQLGDRKIHDAFFCWAAGSKRSIPDITGQFEQLPDGRLKVNPDLSLPGYPDVFAAGDSAAVIPADAPLRKAVNFAIYEGTRAGKNIAARMHGRSTRPFRPLDLGWIIPLHAQSTGKLFARLPIHGRPGLRVHYLMCGARNFSIANALGFTKISLRLFNRETSP